MEKDLLVSDDEYLDFLVTFMKEERDDQIVEITTKNILDHLNQNVPLYAYSKRMYYHLLRSPLYIPELYLK